MPDDGTDFRTLHSVLKAIKEKAIEYAKQVEHRAKLPEKSTGADVGSKY